MQSPVLRAPFTASLSFGPLLALLPCSLAQAPVHAQKTPTPAPAPSPAGDELDGLPSFLLPVPGGSVLMGLTTEQVVAAACQSVSPIKPELAPRYTEKMVRALRLCSSTLGQKPVAVDTFLLGKTPITNAQYEVYYLAMKARGTPVRMPFHWWREGCADDYSQRLPAITQQFPKDENAPLLYWERNWAELPYKLQDRKGKPNGDLPVTYVSLRDIYGFAAWLGMRLPTEAEMTRAMRGDGKQVWPWGDKQPDVYTEQAQALLQLGTGAKPVGSLQASVGPFGHTDLFGNVLQLLGDIGYGPINGKEVFAEEWRRLQKDKVGKVLENPDLWKDNYALAKGSCYLSGNEPIALMIDQRFKFQTIDVFESVGFRLAKSLRPGQDMLLSLARAGYSRDRLAKDQTIDTNAQVGAERYEVDANGFPKAYHAVTFAPVNWLTNDKKLEVGKLVERSQESPLLLGALASTEPMLAPKAKAGFYLVLYRKEGTPKDLVEALKNAIKDVAAQKKKAKPKDEKKDDKKDDKKGEDTQDEKKNNWEPVLARYGQKAADLEDKKSPSDVQFVRIDGTQVPTDSDCLLLVDVEGKIAAAQPVKDTHFTTGAAAPHSLTITADKAGKAVATFAFSTASHEQNNKKAVSSGFQVTLDHPAPDATTPWRQ